MHAGRSCGDWLLIWRRVIEPVVRARAIYWPRRITSLKKCTSRKKKKNVSRKQGHLASLLALEHVSRSAQHDNLGVELRHSWHLKNRPPQGIFALIQSKCITQAILISNRDNTQFFCRTLSVQILAGSINFYLIFRAQMYHFKNSATLSDESIEKWPIKTCFRCDEKKKKLFKLGITWSGTFNSVYFFVCVRLICYISDKFDKRPFRALNGLY